LHLPGSTPGFIRQYFQAAVMELHPDSTQSVQLALLGDALRDRRYPGGSWQQMLAFQKQAAIASGELLALLGPAAPTEPMAPPRLAVTVAPEQVIQGQSFIVRVHGPPGLTLSGQVDGTTIPFAPVQGEYWAVGGFLPVRPPGSTTFALSASDAFGDEVQSAQLTIPVLEGDFATTYVTQEIELPPDKRHLNAPAIVTRENAFLAPIFTRFTPRQLWRGRFIYPASGYVLTTGFGERRIISGQSGVTWHEGLDLALPEGTPFVAANDGIVAMARPTQFRGNMTILDHGMGVYSAYLHQVRFGVSEGDVVRQGQVIGYVGTTGYSTGPHLHWEMRVDNVFVDPDEWTRVSFGP
jgi:hypothetical protein